MTMSNEILNKNSNIMIVNKIRIYQSTLVTLSRRWCNKRPIPNL